MPKFSDESEDSSNLKISCMNSSEQSSQKKLDVEETQKQERLEQRDPTLEFPLPVVKVEVRPTEPE